MGLQRPLFDVRAARGRALLPLLITLCLLAWTAGALADDPPPPPPAHAETEAADTHGADTHAEDAAHAAEAAHGAADDAHGAAHGAEDAHAEDAHGAAHGDDHGEDHGPDLGTILPLWSILPFVGILLSIAIFPLVAPHFWHHHFPKVSAFWALIFAIPFVIIFRSAGVQEILHIYLIDYIPFIILLWSLFTVAGGIYVGGSMRGTPQVNLLLLVIGTALASWIGTTGAAMVMIRPLLRANAWRKNKVHIIVFFIFLVANIGATL